MSVSIAAPTVSTFELTALAPVILFLFVTTYGRSDGLFIATAIGTVLIHVHPYVIEGLVIFIAPMSGVPRIVYTFVPFLQPAVWGTVILAGCILFEFGHDQKY